MNKTLLTTIALAAFTLNVPAGEVGKIYIKKSIGHNFTTKNPHFKTGIGYAFTDNMRGDITFSYAKHKKSKKFLGNTSKAMDSTSTCKAHNVKEESSMITKTQLYQEKKFGLMASGYYDFENVSEYMPYIMVGAGLNRAIEESKEGIKYKTNFAYQFGAGLGYEINENIFLDAEYKILGETKKYKKGFPVMHQTVFTGLRHIF